MSAGEAPRLEPEVAVVCVVCGRSETEQVCSQREVEAQLEYLERFHRRRLDAARRAADEEALADRAAFTQDYATSILRCCSCGLLFRESRPRAKAIAAAYEHDHYGRERLEGLYDSQLELFRAKAERLSGLLPKTREPSIVEIGSFVGGFLGAARERGWRALGIDPGEEVGEFCRARGFTVLQATADDASIEDGSIDCLAIWNTFDQIPDPRPTLDAARGWLRAGGVLAIRVPNGACFRAALGARRRTPLRLRRLLFAAMAWNNLLAFPYLYGHSVVTLDRLLAGFGFARIAVDPDMLTRLADARTKPWAAWEESLLKRAWRGLVSVGVAEAPWLDVYFRRDEDGSAT